MSLKLEVALHTIRQLLVVLFAVPLLYSVSYSLVMLPVTMTAVPDRKIEKKSWVTLYMIWYMISAMSDQDEQVADITNL